MAVKRQILDHNVLVRSTSASWKQYTSLLTLAEILCSQGDCVHNYLLDVKQAHKDNFRRSTFSFSYLHVGLVVKASASRVERGSIFAFSVSILTIRVIPVNSDKWHSSGYLPGAWPYQVSAGTGWLGASTL